MPDAKRFQLLAAPLDRATWLRQALVEPEAHAYGFTGFDPSSPLTSADGTFTLKVNNPARNYLSMHLDPIDGRPRVECGERSNAESLSMSCPIDFEGRAVATLFGGSERYGTHWSIGSFIVDAKP